MKPQSTVGELFQKTGVLPGLVSLSIPLIQLFAALSVEISSAFSIEDFLLFPNFLNLTNFAVLLLILCFIGTFWYWRENEYTIGRKRDRSGEDNSLQSLMSEGSREEKITFKVLLIGAVVSVISLIVFAVTVIVSSQYGIHAFSTKHQLMLSIVQYVSYVTLLSALGTVIYIWLQSWMENAETERERSESDFKKNLLGALDSMGHLTPKVWRKEENKDKAVQGHWEVDLAIGERKYTVMTNYSGDEIYDVKEKKTIPGPVSEEKK